MEREGMVRVGSVGRSLAAPVAVSPCSPSEEYSFDRVTYQPHFWPIESPLWLFNLPNYKLKELLDVCFGVESSLLLGTSSFKSG